MRKYATILLRLTIGVVFLYAAYTKLRDALFAMSVDSYKILPEWAVLVVARALPWFELALGVVLMSGVALRHASLVAAGLLGVFFTLMIVSYARGLTIDCGCFGPGEALGPKTLLRDGTLLSLAIVLAVLAMLPAREITPRKVAPEKLTMSV
jgi:putative oxidoreductase